jgi:hypothetical protein
MTVTVLNEGLGITAFGIKVFDDIDSNYQRIATTRQELLLLFQLIIYTHFKTLIHINT